MSSAFLSAVGTIRWTLIVFAGLATLWSGQASAEKLKPQRRCTTPAGWRILARDSQAVVISGHVRVRDVDGQGAPGREKQWRYCLYRRDRFRVLVTDAGANGGYADIYRIGRLALSGVFVAYDSTDYLGGGRYGVSLGVDVTDVRSGRHVDAKPTGSSFVSILLAPPFAAWISSSEQPDWFVQSLNGRTGQTTTLDSTCSTADCSTAETPDPFGDLRLTRCLAGCTTPGATFVWWTRNGNWRSVPIGN